MKYPKRYIPKSLSKKDRNKQIRQINKSKKEYTRGKYYKRKYVSSFKSIPSKHILAAQKLYKMDKIYANRELAKKTQCSIGTLKKIEQKGMGAYYSSGSRPNQTPQSWGRARLASSITGGKASAVDYKLLSKRMQTF